jgi:ComF family protein
MTKTEPLPTQVRSLFYHDSPICDWIHRYKYHRQLYFARLFSDLMLRRFERDAQDVQACIPMPLHPKKQRLRGFNQSLEIAKFLGTGLKIPVIQAFHKVRHTANQADLSREERLHNLKGAFYMEAEKLQGLNSLLLVDDVMTTGASLNQLTQLIKQDCPDLKIRIWTVSHGHAKT